MPLLLADFIYTRDCKLNLRKNVDTTLSYAQMVLGGTLINYLKDIVSPHSLELDNYS